MLSVSADPATLAGAIARLGFRRWYERQLVESHAWLATCFLAMLVLASGLELLSFEESIAEFVFDAALVAGGAALAWVAWRRYASIMQLAERVGEQAVCPACGRYGFRCEPAQRGDRALRARCGKCGHLWEVSTAAE